MAAIRQGLPRGTLYSGPIQPSAKARIGCRLGRRGSQKRVWSPLAGFLAALAGSTLLSGCNVLLPDEYAINAPMVHTLFGIGTAPPDGSEIDLRMQVPPGFGVSLYASDLPNVRALALTREGDLLASLPREGRVEWLARDADGDGHPDARRTLLSDRNRPYGLALRGGWLYVAETDAIGRIRFDAATGHVAGPFEHIVEGLPADGNHWSRTLAFGPDGRLYVSVGSSCNVCLEEDPRRAAILRFDADGRHPETVATGLRNSVGFDWQPGTGRLFATDNGRDLLGDDFPPEELNEIEAGKFYGWPIAHGDRIPDPDFGSGREAEIRASTPPTFHFPAHNAPLGMRFLRSAHTAPGYEGAAVVALHGSWNRSRKDGYKVVSLHWDEAGRITQRDLLTGFLVDEDVSGRPADVVEGPDGAIYVSDDYAGAIWRIAYGGTGGRTAAAPVRRVASGSVAGAVVPGDVAHGRRLFAEKGCATCHDATQAAPGVVPVPLRNLRARYSPADLDALLRTPPPPMPVPDLDPVERRDLVAALLAAGGAPSN